MSVLISRRNNFQCDDYTFSSSLQTPVFSPLGDAASGVDIVGESFISGRKRNRLCLITELRGFSWLMLENGSRRANQVDRTFNIACKRESVWV